MPWVPTASADVVNVACPKASMATGAPRSVPPSVNVTVPVVAGPPFAGPLVMVTVAVNVTVWPKVEGFGDDVSVVALSAFATT